MKCLPPRKLLSPGKTGTVGHLIVGENILQLIFTVYFYF